VTFEVSSCTKFQIFRGSTSDPAEGGYSAPPDARTGGKGDRCLSPRISPKGRERGDSWGIFGNLVLRPSLVKNKSCPPSKNKFGLTPRPTAVKRRTRLQGWKAEHLSVTQSPLLQLHHLLPVLCCRVTRSF